jgi:hypothetical protein
MPRVRRLPALLFALAALTAAGGCGGGGDDKTERGRAERDRVEASARESAPGRREGAAARALADAGRRTAAAGTAQVAMTIDLPPPDSLKGSGVGVVDFKRDRSLLAFSFETGGRRSDAELFLTGGRQLVRLDSDDRWREGETGPNFEVTSLSAIGSIGRVATDVRRSGSGRIRGARCTRYLARLDLDRAALQVPERRRREYLAGTRAFRVRKLPTVFYVGPDGRICRQRIELTEREFDLSGGGGRGLSIDYDLYGYGKPPSPPVPRPGE